MNVLAADLAHYSKAYNVFVEKTGKHTSDRKWAEENFPSAVVHKLGEIRPSDHILRSLGVGSGSGEYDIILLRMFSQRFACFNHVVLEPARVYLEEFQSAATKESSSADWSVPGAANFEWHNETLEEYMAKKSGQSNEGSPQQFDFISAVHSLYYVDDLRVALKFLYDSLAPGGILLTTLLKDTSSLNAHEFRKEDYTSSTRVKRILKELDIPFTISEQRVTVDITSIFDQGSAEGNLLLDFLTHVGHFRESATKEMEDAVLTKFRKQAREYRVARRADAEPGSAGAGHCDPDGDNERILIERIWENVIITKA
ncbi:histamine N-methyltransferase-like [Diadema antillarum]|uniref:histamine N-methyltransferase-like n=1 Tax=Diadema antillarum TaxID=105358 RepID=UPI003A8A29C9